MLNSSIFNIVYPICCVFLFFLMFVYFYTYTTKTNTYYKKEVSELKAKQKKLQAELSEKTMLVNEFNHRTKNNLQILVCLMNIQSRAAQKMSLESFVSVCTCRIQSMLAIYQHLSDHGAVSINLAHYIGMLLTKIEESYALTPAHFDVHIDPINTSEDQAKYIGLLSVELITNSVKYASHSSKIHIRIEQLTEKKARLTYYDSEEVTAKHTLKKELTQGLKLIHSLINHMNGTLLSSTNFNYEIEINL